MNFTKGSKMNHQKYKDMLQLNILGELNENEEVDLENHLLECSECQKEYTKQKKFYSIIVAERPSIPSDDDLTLARTKLLNTIHTNESKLSISESFKKYLDELFFTPYRFALGGIVLLTIGMLTGYLLFGISQSPPKILSENVIDLDKLGKGNVKISNIRFPETVSDDGDFEFKIGNNIPMVYKGNLSDSIVQRLLANALIETENPGFKIKTVSTIAKQAKSIFNPDPQIKKALILSLKNDKNPVVRKEALNALINFSFEKDIKEAILFTLGNDENSNNRIAAINALLEINSVNQSLDSGFQNLLEQNILNEKNELVKLKTTKLLHRGK
ncbi:MAG: hypothetical protein GY936_05050 [Ignavibacteriae bacterium]|nr:hypothetical protein [Ignavibacteriota bacterium]